MDPKDIIKAIKEGDSSAEFRKKRIHAIDISNHQPNVDWDKIAETQTFVYLKSTEGVSFVDKSAHKHGEGAESVGLPFGYYHFATPYPNDAVAEAKDFVKTLRDLPHWTLVPVLDLEKNKKGMSRSEMEKWCKEFNNVVEQELGCTPMMYGSPGLLDSYLPPDHDLGHMPLWIAHYAKGIDEPRVAKGWNEWSIWQYADKNHPIEGAGKNIDVNWSTVDFLWKNTVR